MLYYPRVTIVIANFNGYRDLSACLQSIKKISYPRLSTIVFDNGSTEGDAPKIARNFPWVKLFAFKKNYGFTGGYNRVLKQLNSPFVFLVNNDTVLTPSSIEKLVTFAQTHPDVAIIQPKILSLQNKGMFEYAGACGGYVDKLGYPYCRGRVVFTVEKDRGQYDTVADIFWVSGTAMFCSLSAIRRVGFFDEDLFAYVEENDLCWRLIKKGYRIISLPQAIIYHKGLGSWGKYQNKKTYLIHRNNILILVKHLATRRLTIVLPLRIMMDYLSMLYYAREGNIGFVLSVLHAHKDIVRLFGRFWRKRTKRYEERERTIESTLMWPTSIVFEYFVRKKKYFSEIKYDPKAFYFLPNTAQSPPPSGDDLER